MSEIALDALGGGQWIVKWGSGFGPVTLMTALAGAMVFAALIVLEPLWTSD